MTTAYSIAGSPAPYWLKDIAHIDNMAVTLTRANPNLGWVAETHIVVEGTVIYRRLEDDGDIHFKIVDVAGHVLTCEIDPQHPLPEPALNEAVRVYGVFRWDFDHGWWEIHPVDHWEPTSTTPAPWVAPA